MMATSYIYKDNTILFLKNQKKMVYADNWTNKQSKINISHDM